MVYQLPPCAGAIENIPSVIACFENMISETEMLNKISSHNQMTKNAQRAFLREEGRSQGRASMRRLVLLWGWLVARA